jgi:hypothetical protein
MSGHGHVTPNADGSKARCGGPGICAECSRELAAKQIETPTIKVRYSCDLCGLKDIEVEVPMRGNEDVLQWMDNTIIHLGQDHMQRSPRCFPDKLVRVMIPITGAEKIGGPAVQ